MKDFAINGVTFGNGTTVANFGLVFCRALILFVDNVKADRIHKNDQEIM